MRSVIDRNVVMRRMTISLWVKAAGATPKCSKFIIYETKYVVRECILYYYARTSLLRPHFITTPALQI
jgi:hypothetical protein